MYLIPILSSRSGFVALGALAVLWTFLLGSEAPAQIQSVSPGALDFADVDLRRDLRVTDADWSVELPQSDAAHLSSLGLVSSDSDRKPRQGRRARLIAKSRGRYEPKFVSPRGLAILPYWVEGDFRFEVEVMALGEETPHRDAVLVFAWQSSTQFDYAHVATRADEVAHQIHRVDQADRKPFTSARSSGVDWGRAEWRKLVLERRGDEVRLQFDGEPSSVLRGRTKARAGWLGMGSFDDPVAFRKVVLTSLSAKTRWSRKAPTSRGSPYNSLDELYRKPSLDELYLKPSLAETETADGAVREKSDSLAESSHPRRAGRAKQRSNTEFIAGAARRVDADGGWCWFEGPRALVRDGKLIVGSVPSGWLDAERRGDIEVHIHDLATGRTKTIELSDRLELDDHNQPALLSLPDGRLLAAYCKHGSDRFNRSRRSWPDDLERWDPEVICDWGKGTYPTYSNLVRLESEGGRIYNFFRNLDRRWKPSWMYSDDNGASWQRGGILIEVPDQFRHRPYAIYGSDGRSRIHMAYTEGHPRNFDNSIYHLYLSAGQLHRSGGERIASLKKGLERPEQGELVFRGNSEAVAWTVDLCVDSDGEPRILFSVQRDGAGVRPGKGGLDHRYFVARRIEGRWVSEQIAFAGRRLYSGEDDYTGLAAFDPANPDRVVLSTDADPATGKPLLNPEGKRRHELYLARRGEDGRWTHRPLTANSRASQLRPICAVDPRSGVTWVTWLRGEYRSYQDYRQEIMATALPR